MRKLILIALAGILMVPVAAAQDQWNYKESFTTKATSGHGIAVDPDGKIWWQPFSATDSVKVDDIDGTYKSTRVIYVFNPDGTEASISPIKFLDYGGGVVDTLGGYVTRNSTGAKAWEGRSGRGLRMAADGNIIATQFVTHFKIDYKTGAGIARFDAGATGVASGVASETGHVFVAPVVPGNPLIELDADLNSLGNALDATLGFSRSFEARPDGNGIYWAGYTLHGIILYERADEFSAFDSMGVVIPGVDSESMGYQPGTGWLWVSAGSYNDGPNRLEGVTTNWLPMTHYAFDPAELAVDQIPTPKAFLTYHGSDDCRAAQSDAACGRPRGIAFSPDGQMAYITNFSVTGDQQVEVFSAMPVAIEKVDSSIPDQFVLMQAYPNPFNPSTMINFMLHEAGHARLSVYDMTGREVAVLADQAMAPGTYQYQFDATGLSSGVYLYRLDFNGQMATGRMTLVK